MWQWRGVRYRNITDWPGRAVAALLCFLPTLVPSSVPSPPQDPARAEFTSGTAEASRKCSDGCPMLNLLNHHPWAGVRGMKNARKIVRGSEEGQGCRCLRKEREGGEEKGSRHPQWVNEKLPAAPRPRFLPCLPRPLTWWLGGSEGTREAGSGPQVHTHRASASHGGAPGSSRSPPPLRTATGYLCWCTNPSEALLPPDHDAGSSNTAYRATSALPRGPVLSSTGTLCSTTCMRPLPARGVSTPHPTAMVGACTIPVTP